MATDVEHFFGSPIPLLCYKASVAIATTGTATTEATIFTSTASPTTKAKVCSEGGREGRGSQETKGSQRGEEGCKKEGGCCVNNGTPRRGGGFRLCQWLGLRFRVGGNRG